MKITTKQKTLAIITLCAFGYVGYEIYSMMKEDIEPVGNQTWSRAATRHSGSALDATATETRIEPALSEASLPASRAAASPVVNQESRDSKQKVYLEMVNEYELAKMKHRLLEERAAIAAAEQRIASLKKQTQAINQQLANNNTAESSETSSADEFRLSYVDEQNKDWSATLVRAGHYYQVHIGSHLPDGSAVVAISHRGVVTQLGEALHRITFDGETTESNTSKVSTVANKPKTTVVLKPKTSTPMTQPKTSAVVEKTKTPAVVIKPKKSTPVAKRPVPAKTSIVCHDAACLFSLPPTHYTIQLIGSYREEVITNFVLANELKDKTVRFHVMNGKRRWHMLFYGNFSSEKEAIQALGKLPRDWTSEHPWIRSIKTLKNATKKTS